MKKYPGTFDPVQYVAWHNRTHTQDADLAHKLAEMRVSLKESALDDLKFLDRLLHYFLDFAEKSGKRPLGKFEFPLTVAVSDVSCLAYDLLFKSETSILNKLWRKNKERKKDEFVTLASIRQEITDLIRSEIIGESLSSCQRLSDAINAKNILDQGLKEEYSKYLVSISVEPEMKMSSGYFAYHVMFYFKSGNIVEIQIYSSMMKKWRDLSHHLYEVVRLNPVRDHGFGTKESRMISLGHLLHIAECEIERLEEEISKSTLIRK
jgi:ppGpp synthetase/RelA/SpoT-type nucleotidyltranferase